jgi:hypothetical protein
MSVFLGIADARNTAAKNEFQDPVKGMKKSGLETPVRKKPPSGC